MDQTTADERWLAVPGWEGLYEVSDRGQVRSLDRTGWRVDGRVLTYHGRVLNLNVQPQGYRDVTLTSGPRRERWLVHALVLTTFVGPRPVGLESCHDNGVRHDNRLVNLRWDTPLANGADRVRHGTSQKPRRRQCPRGHAFNGPNVGLHANGQRACVACRRAHKVARGRRDKGLPALDFQTLADEKFAELMRPVVA